MDIDIKAGTITFRVLYTGPEGACKLLSIRGLHGSVGGARGSRISVLHTETDRVVSFPFKPPGVAPVMGLQVVFRAMTVAGVVRSQATEKLLLLAADGVVFLPDRAHPAGRSTRSAFGHLLDELRAIGRDPRGIPVVVQDYTDGRPRLEARHLPGVSGFDPVLVPVAGDTTEGVSRVFEVARTRVLDRFREIERRFGAEEGREMLAEQIAVRTSPLEIPPSRRPAMGRGSLLTIILLLTAAVAALLLSLLV